MKKLIILIGPPGSGKSTLAKEYEAQGYVRISQDDQGKINHWDLYVNAMRCAQNVVVDRMNFDKKQRAKYIEVAKIRDYKINIIVLHESQATCLDRMLKREGHPTIQDEKSARAALHTFFRFYERPQEGEADEIAFRYPEGDKPSAVICDLDGTLCNIEHRLHFVRDGKKDWKNFMYNIPYDSVNNWCKSLIQSMDNCGYEIVYCSGRGDENRGATRQWLLNEKLLYLCKSTDLSEHEHLYMREAKDSRPDTQIKENILDFEILTRFTPLFAVDDRPNVCRMWRRRGIVCLQCNDVEF